jgi:hypothetical protein
MKVACRFAASINTGNVTPSVGAEAVPTMMLGAALP